MAATAVPTPPRTTRERDRGAMLIGKLARLTGRSVHTIRWYESQRLMPGVRRDLQGRRIYADGHVQWLELLERLRRSGMSIRDLREYTGMAKRGASTLKESRELLQAHRRRIEASIRDLHESLALIDAKVAFYDEWQRSGVKPPPLPKAKR
ncbi:MAG: MerR family transcriptional regulator [Steroidobacter sp.]